MVVIINTNMLLPINPMPLGIAIAIMKYLGFVPGMALAIITTSCAHWSSQWRTNWVGCTPHRSSKPSVTDESAGQQTFSLVSLGYYVDGEFWSVQNEHEYIPHYFSTFIFPTISLTLYDAVIVNETNLATINAWNLQSINCFQSLSLHSSLYHCYCCHYKLLRALALVVVVLLLNL